MISGIFYNNYSYKVPNSMIYVIGNNTEIIDTLFSDERGIFKMNLPLGIYRFHSEAPFVELSSIYEININNQNFDIPYSQYNCEDKPNIYLYTEKETIVDVSIKFPKDGKIIESIPAYENGWKNLNIKPNGLINDKFSFLFYESFSESHFQKEVGWVVQRENLASFFQKNLRDYGLNDQEISDFLEYWIPSLSEFHFYAIYPQIDKQLDLTVALEISPKPDNIRRLLYYFEKLDNNSLKLPAPKIEKFNRTGFHVLEWGGSTNFEYKKPKSE